MAFDEKIENENWKLKTETENWKLKTEKAVCLVLKIGAEKIEKTILHFLKWVFFTKKIQKTEKDGREKGKMVFYTF